MSFQSLKFKIALNLAVIILISVLLSDFVIVSIIQKRLIRERVARGRQILSLLPDAYADQQNRITDLLLHDASVFYLYIRSANGTSRHYGHVATDQQKEIHKTAEPLLRGEGAGTEFFGDTFGVFRHQKKYVLISEPAAGDNPGNSSEKLIVMSLDDIYRALRQSQKIVVLYVVANVVILLLFGVYRLSRLIIRPIHRFIKMTDDFREKDRLYFTHGKNYQEFNQLSKALNHMMDQIETDKEKLRNSLNELERSNSELQNAQNEIVQAEKLASVGRLSAGIAHEIGNPIGIVLGYLDLLKKRPDMKNDAIGQDYLNRAEAEINRINTIIRQLLDFSRSSSNDGIIVSMHEIVSDVVSMMSDQPFMTDIMIDCRLDAVEHTVRADSDQIRQVLINLIINAADSIKASDNNKKGSIRLISEYVAENEKPALNGRPTFLLKVIDNGAGISGEHIDYIFDPFFTTKEPGKGTGLGLSVSYMIIEQAGGRIGAGSEIGQGTTMTILLPLHHEKEFSPAN